MSDDIRESTCCPSTTAVGGEQVDTVFGYRVDRNDAHPPPVVTCPDNFTAWMIGSQYIVPDFSSVIEIDGQCAIDSEFTITQNPAAGTVITIGGTITILITVGDRFANIVTCSFNIDVRNPDPNTTLFPPDVLPPWVYTPNLFAYYSFNDTLCAFGADDQDPPCWFRRDLSEIIGNTSPRNLSNGGDVIFLPNESPVPLLSSSPPPFNRGSAWITNQANAYLSFPDDPESRLLSTDFTIRIWFKLISVSDTWNLVGKFGSVGYRLKIVRSAGSYRLSAELKNSTTTLATNYYLVTYAVWTHAIMTFEAALGRLRLYVDGTLIDTATSAGFALSGDIDQFRIGQPSSATPLGDAMVCWPLDTTGWQDSVGSRHLTNAGNAALDTGKINSCVRANLLANSYLTVPDDAGLRLTATDFTIRTWVKVITFPPSTSSWVIFSKANTLSKGYQLRVFSSSGLMAIQLRLWSDAGTLLLNLVSGSTFALNAFHHIVCTYNASTRTAKLYVNNVLSATGIATGDLGTSTEPLQLGDATAGADIYQDETALWASEWDAARVTTDYAANVGTSCSAMSAGSGELFKDEVGIWRAAWSSARVAADYALMT